ncbi:CD206 [Mytilus edulis]|uniref:MRC n=1 Tax=Mytilus edulis TaxID=6550 RepID=A0A8S3PUL7_MYTED|nr:CD206 [Mytilus edulis]
MKKEAFICVILAIILSANGQVCPPGWVDGPMGKKCYLFADNHKRNWFEAKYVCNSMRAQLLSIEDSLEMSWIKQELRRVKAKATGTPEWWTSLQKNETVWNWSSNIALDDTVVRWGSGEPNNYMNKEHCAEICCPHFLNDINCEKESTIFVNLIKTNPLTCDADNGWEYHQGSCYKFVQKFKTWNESESDCKALDSNLAAVADTGPLHAVSTIASFQQFDSWVGIIRNYKTYFYTNSSEAIGIDSYIQPSKTTDNFNPACLTINSTVKDAAKGLYPDSCTTPKPYICQKPEGVCKPGYQQHQSICYYTSYSEHNRSRAETLCQAMKMSVVDITSASKSSYLVNLLKRKGDIGEIWIGLKKQSTNNWYWPSTGEVPALKYWTYISPNSNETMYDCVYMNVGDDGRWNRNLPCNRTLRVVCEVPATTSFTTTTVVPPTTTTTPAPATTSTTTMKSTNAAMTKPGVSTAVPEVPCRMEWCEDLFDQAKEFENQSPTMIQAAKRYSEPPHCITIRTRVKCLQAQHDQCKQHFNYKTQVVGLPQIMDVLGCSNSTSAAVFDPKTMVQECIMDQMGKGYRGTISQTNTGRTCQAWSSQVPHKHSYSDQLLDQKNYCRNADDEPYGPWCYTTDVNQRWEYCKIPYCAGAVTPVIPTTTTSTTTTVVTTAAKTWSEKCGLFWEDSPIPDVCYHFDNRLSSWMEARTKCQMLGGKLVSITSTHEQLYLAGRLQNSNFGSMWIGANCRGSDEGWRWSDGSPFSFLHWMQDQPDGLDNGEDCVSMDTKFGQWEDQACDVKQGFVCRKTVAGPTLPPIPPTSPVIGKGQTYGCPDGWVSYRSNCYLIARKKTTWNVARSICRKNGSDLASIAEEGEQDFITSQIPKTHCYNMHSNDTQCDKWRDQGECQKNPVWMARSCHKSCNYCIRDCKNIHYSVECDHWASVGECYKNPSYMLKNCPLSCGTCDSAIYGGLWIGLSDTGFQMNFKWSDDSTVKYTKWAKTEPNNWNGETRTNGKWNDVPCEMANAGFICKKRKQVLNEVTQSPLAIGCVNNTIGYDAYCYGFNDETTDWATAESVCAQVQYGHLATINNVYTQLFLASQIAGKSGHYWVGLTQDVNSGAMVSWTSGLPVSYTAWSRSHTGSIDEDAMCVAMTATHPIGLWETKNCTFEKSYICEYPREGYTTPTTTTTTIAPVFCPSTWLEFNGYCYKNINGNGAKRTWMKSRDFCQERGADLASIHSSEESDFLKNRMIGYRDYGDVWVGLNDRDSENGFEWSDGSPVDFMMWGPNEPNDKYQQEDCGMLNRYSNGWNDDNCYKTKNFVCKIQKGMPLIEPNDTYTKEYCDSESDWLYFDGYCYFIKKYDSKNFKEASKLCYEKKSSLLSIHSQHESNWLLEQIHQKSDMWIGLNKLNRQYEGYRWSDNSPVDFISWGSGKPSNTAVNKCVKIQSGSGRWEDFNCNRRIGGYICKRKNDTDSFTTTPAPTMPTVRGGCLGGFVRSTFNSKCYGFFKTQKTWSQAKATCEAYGKTYSLVTIHSELEQMFINSMLYDSEEMVWIGMTDEHTYRKYYWDDGSEVTYTNWNSAEPNGYNEHCAVNSKYYICQGLQNPIFPIDTSESDSEYCLPGYTKYDQMCYKLFEATTDWNTSLSKCQEDGGSLASIRNLAEKSFVSYLTYNKSSLPFWIGLNNMNSKDGITYKWINGWPVIYTNWNSDNLPSKPCIAVGEDFWADKDCDTKLPSLCQINKIPLPKVADQFSCKDGGYVFGDRCYYPLLHNPLTWVKAKEECGNKGLTLTSIQSLDQIEYLINLIQKLARSRLKVWIGLSKLNRNSYSWSWVDSSPKTFENWASGEPSTTWRSTAEECVEMNLDGTWNDINCQRYERPFICSSDQGQKCRMNVLGANYRGNINQTKTGRTCQAWSSQTPQKHKFSKKLASEKNYCRNPDSEPYGPWCYTTDKNKRWEYCDTPYCDEAVTPPITTSTTTKAVTTVAMETTEATSTYLPTTTTPPVAKPIDNEFISQKRVSGVTTGLTTGQIIGILIGILGCFVIVAAILFIIRFNRQNDNYKPKTHSFANALYLKTSEEINEDDPNAMGSTVKICGADPL